MKKRAESFFGMHFDFHAKPGEIVGADPRPDVIEKMLDLVAPDYIQCDTKGHHGLSSYPTKVGNQADIIQSDILKMWRELTAKRGIALYGHHSGLFDIKALQIHPSWAVVDENGVASKEYASVFGPYVDEQLIPQILELAEEYHLDGVWVDGECWGAKLDYSVHAINAYLHKTGKEPPKKHEADFEEYKEFCRQGFRDYVRHYVSAVKEKAPDFQITSNWMYSAYMPERPDVLIDFISGDYASKLSYYNVRWNARCIANQGRPWDLMAWGHNCEASFTIDDRNTKEATQLCQEAAVVLALGGGFQFFNIQYRGGSTIQEWAIPSWKEVERFVRARELFCRDAVQVPQIGILYAGLEFENQDAPLYSTNNIVLNAVKGLVQAVQDSQQSSEILMQHHLFDRDLSRYGLIIIGKTSKLTQNAKDVLIEYVKNGGSLLLASPQSADLFADCFEVQLLAPQNKLIFIECDNKLSPIETECAQIQCSAEKVCGIYYNENHMERAPHPAAAQYTYGNGKVICLGFDFGTSYENARTPCLRSFFQKQVNMLFDNPIVQVEGSSYADVIVMEKEGKLHIHLINSAGPHNDMKVRGFHEIPRIGPLTVTVRCKQKPQHIFIEPDHVPCQFEWANEQATFNIKTLEIHRIVVIG